MVKINKDVPLNKNGQNSNIKFHILDVSIMQSYGFGYTYGQWIYNIGLTDSISLNITITDNNDGQIDILDDTFLQPYDFQSMIMSKGNNAPSVAKTVQKKVYEIMEGLSYYGIISGWNYGDYI